MDVHPLTPGRAVGGHLHALVAASGTAADDASPAAPTPAAALGPCAAPAAEPLSHPLVTATAGATPEMLIEQDCAFSDEDPAPWLEQVRCCAAPCAVLCMLRRKLAMQMRCKSKVSAMSAILGAGTGSVNELRTRGVTMQDADAPWRMLILRPPRAAPNFLRVHRRDLSRGVNAPLHVHVGRRRARSSTYNIPEYLFQPS